MMADQKRHAGLISRGAQAFAFIECMRDGLLDQRRNTRADAFERLLDMQLVRRGKHHAIGTAGGEQFAERAKERHVGLFRHFLRGGTRIDDCSQAATRTLLDQFDVTSADKPGAGDGKLHLSHDFVVFSAQGLDVFVN